MMNKSDFQIFDLYSEAVVAGAGGRVFYANPAAAQFFGRGLTGEMLSAIFPAALIQPESGHYTGSTRLCGLPVTVDARRMGEALVFSVFVPDPAREETLLESTGSIIRNQAAVIQLAYSFLQPHIDDMGNDKLSAYAAMLSHSCRQLLRLADHLVITSQALSDMRPPADFPVLDLGQLCRNLLDTLELFGPLHKVRFKLDLPVQPVLFAGPQDRIEQMLLNLLSNSFKYTPPGGTVSLRAASGAAGPCLSVSDTGCGIPNEKLLHIFQAWRAPQELGDPHRGAGLGLTVSRKIAEYLGGTLLLESRAGQGTCVTVQLPDNVSSSLMVREPARPDESGMLKILTELSDVLDYTCYSALYSD